jgi:alpha-1,2-mannosyltransferase
MIFAAWLADRFNAAGIALDRRRIVVGCGLLLLIQLVAWASLAARNEVPLDFLSFYAAGALADAGTPQLAYDYQALRAAEEHLAGSAPHFFYYPPVFLLLCAAFAKLPYGAAALIFEAVTLGLYLAVGRVVSDERGWLAFVPLLAFPAVFWNLAVAQNAFLTASLFGGATLLVDRRPIAAGLLFGALSYKPHLALLVPIALGAGGHSRAFAAAAASGIVLCLISLAAFGPTTWAAFFDNALTVRGAYDHGPIGFGAFVSPFGAAMQFGASSSACYAVQAMATVGAAATVAWSWRRALPLSLRGAMLAAATLVAVPTAFFYDLMLAAIAGAWLVRATGEANSPEWQKPVLAILFLAAYLTPTLGYWLPIGALTAVALLLLVAAISSRSAAMRSPRPALAATHT